MTSLGDRSLDPERRRRPTPRPRRRELPWGLYVGFLGAVGVALFLATRTGATWPRWVIAALVVAVVAWVLWERRRTP